jgi:hypothetical protein
MTINEIIRRIRQKNNDSGAKSRQPDTYYNDMIISAFGDLEAILGKISFRSSKYQFIPMRDSEMNIDYEDDGVTPEIDPTIYYNPDEPYNADIHIPVNAIVNKGLSIAEGEEYAQLETADFYDNMGLDLLQERDIAFIKIDVLGSTDVEFTVDVSLDGRESWIVADYEKVLDFDNGATGTTGYVDVSDLPSSRVALKWRVTVGTIKSTIFERYYIPETILRNYANDIVNLAYAQILETDYKDAIENQNDPMVINGIKAQIDAIRQTYGLGRGGNIKPAHASPQAAVYFPESREENKILGIEEYSTKILSDKRVVSIKSDGTIRRI